jgi:hypothetical protein
MTEGVMIEGEAMLGVREQALELRANKNLRKERVRGRECKRGGQSREVVGTTFYPLTVRSKVRMITRGGAALSPLCHRNVIFRYYNVLVSDLVGKGDRLFLSDCELRACAWDWTRASESKRRGERDMELSLLIDELVNLDDDA